MAIAKIILNNTTQMDLTADTVTTSDHIMEGYVGHLRNGTSVTGTGKIAASEQAALDALVRYSNEVTGESDTTISEAVETLVDGYGGGSTPQKVSGSFELDTSGKTITIVHNLGVVPTFAQIYATSELSYADWGTTYISYTSGIPTERVGNLTVPNTYKVLREERDASTSRYMNNNYSARDSITENEVVFSGRINFFAGTYHYDIFA